MTGSGKIRQTHILDDDPTGTQSVQDAPVVLWSQNDTTGPSIPTADTVYHLTNTRALDPHTAGALITTVVKRIVASDPSARIVLRGDSTLRGHVYEEYIAAAAAAYTEPPVLLLVPSMPDAGRVTVGGIHFIDDGETRTPVASTPYAADPRLGYRESHLLEWADERSNGTLPASAGRVVELGDLRSRGADAVVEALTELSHAGTPSVCAVDAETHDDLAIAADGLVAAEQAGANVLIRSAPPFAAILGRCLADTLQPVPRSNSVVVVCGSFVPLATHQLASLSMRYPHSSVEANIDTLLKNPVHEQTRLARELETRLIATKVAVLTTPRRPPTDNLSFADSLQIAETLAGVLRRISDLPKVVIAKGGITSATVVSEGLAASNAWVAGPAMTGVATWRVDTRGSQTEVLIVPGNVGSHDLLTDLVSGVTE